MRGQVELVWTQVSRLWCSTGQGPERELLREGLEIRTRKLSARHLNRNDAPNLDKDPHFPDFVKLPQS